MTSTLEDGALARLGIDVRVVVYEYLGYQSISIALLRQTCPWLKKEITDTWMELQSRIFKPREPIRHDEEPWLVDATQLDGCSLDLVQSTLPSLIDVHHSNEILANAIQSGRLDDVTALVSRATAFTSRRFKMSTESLEQLVTLLEHQQDSRITAFFTTVSCPKFCLALISAAIAQASYRLVEAVPNHVWIFVFQAQVMYLTVLDMTCSALMAVGKDKFSRTLKCVLKRVVPFVETILPLQQLVEPWRGFNEECDNEDMTLVPYIVKSLSSVDPISGPVLMDNCLTLVFAAKKESLVNGLFDEFVRTSNLYGIKTALSIAARLGNVKLLRTWTAIRPDIDVTLLDEEGMLDIGYSALHTALLQGVDEMIYLVETYITPLGIVPLMDVHDHCLWSEVFQAHYRHVGGEKMTTTRTQEFQVILRYLTLQYDPEHVALQKLFVHLMLSDQFVPAALSLLLKTIGMSLFADASVAKAIILNCASDRTFTWLSDRLHIDIVPKDAIQFIESKMEFANSFPASPHRLSLSTTERFARLREGQAYRARLPSEAHRIVHDTIIYTHYSTRTIVSRLVALGVPVETLCRFDSYASVIVKDIPHMIDYLPDGCHGLENLLRCALRCNQVNVTSRLISRGVKIILPPSHVQRLREPTNSTPRMADLLNRKIGSGTTSEPE